MTNRSEVPESKRAFSVDEFCASYGVGRTWLYRQINEGRLKARRAVGRTIIAREDAEAWLATLPEHIPARAA